MNYTSNHVGDLLLQQKLRHHIYLSVRNALMMCSASLLIWSQYYEPFFLCH
jgi:hypothetical protein